MAYVRLVVLLAASTALMYGLMYLNTFAGEHIRFSQTRLWMALIMGAAMAIVMVLGMWRMYPNRRLNFLLLASAAVIFTVSLWLVRSQATVGDVAYMKAMIPHHSIAVLTSTRAEIRDPRVRRLADEIVAAQVREIAEMNVLIAELERTPPAGPRLPPGASVGQRQAPRAEGP